jgi:membrane protein DedA with SNARE-associated domain
MGDDPRLATPGPGEDEERPISVSDGITLRRIQTGKKRFRVQHRSIVPRRVERSLHLDVRMDVPGLPANVYALVVVAAALDATALPFPGRLILAGAGAMAAAGGAHVTLVIALGALAVLAVDHLWYFAGEIAEGPMMKLVKWVTARSTRAARKTAQEYFDRWGGLTFLVGRFVAVVRIVAWPLARATGISYVRFLVLDALAAAVWTTTWVGLGFILGPRLYALMERIGMPLTIGLAIAAGVGGILAMRLLRQRRGRGGQIARAS